MTKNKVLTIGMPRTGSTVLLTHVSHHLKIQQLGEIFGPNGPGFDSLTSGLAWLQSQQPGVLKILTGQLNLDQIDEFIEQSSIAEVVLLHRRNYTECCISQHFAKLINKFHFQRSQEIKDYSSFELPQGHVDYWLNNVYQPYQAIATRWQQFPHTDIIYEDMINDAEMQIGGKQFKLSDFTRSSLVSPGFDYQQLCKNYNDVDSYIKKNTSLTPIQ